ncbi:nitroreductase [Oceanobacillus piezotolerans]|uniref:Nitroreductase n=1 Tax=Oceanobacillus piezotolerans TaxID=2448030 RepID=A0A498D898_9BACI|nr:nitroreductase [Oceanobacillus piezotolerans]RLL46603.1 nitroreductase [Oceanobacillus piezotolerans]
MKREGEVISILETIQARRSIHQLKEQPVDLSVLKEIFTYASYAPTHYMKEPWQIKIYQGHGREAIIDAIIRSYQRIGMIKNEQEPKTKKMIHSMKEFLLKIPHHALIYFEKEEDSVRYEEEYASVCAFIQNAQLAAWEYGVGMLWTITPYMHDPIFLDEIGLDNERFKIAAVLQIGYPAKVPRKKERTPIEGKLEIIE